MPDLMGEGLARDEAMNHGQRVIYFILCLVSDIELTEHVILQLNKQV